MMEHDAVQTAPAIIVLNDRTAKCSFKLRTGQKIQRILKTLEDQDVSPCKRIGNPWHIKEVESGRTNTELRVVLIEQVPHGGHG